jgi:hypothetical protein
MYKREFWSKIADQPSQLKFYPELENTLRLSNKMALLTDSYGLSRQVSKHINYAQNMKGIRLA